MNVSSLLIGQHLQPHGSRRPVNFLIVPVDVSLSQLTVTVCYLTLGSRRRILHTKCGVVSGGCCSLAVTSVTVTSG